MRDSDIVASMTPASIVMVPGWTNSGPGHWQSIWQRAHAEYHRIEQADWEKPDPSDWLEKIDETVADGGKPIIFVAHSLGCIAAVVWSQRADPVRLRRITGAMLVAPADVEQTDTPQVLQPWRPVPLKRLPFPSVLVASRTDDSTSFIRSQEFAAAWGSQLVEIGNAGHINTSSGHGAWPEGEHLLADFVARVT